MDHLTARARGIVSRLIAGESVPLGGKAIRLSNEAARLLSALIPRMAELEEVIGAALATRIKEHFEQEEESTPPSIAQQVAALPASWKLHQLRAYSFRGLAPGQQEWSFNFAGQSHLLYGPNGCGKSSLLSAILWCLTGHIQRDDSPPSVPEDVTVYKSGKRATATSRSPALSLTDSTGTSLPSKDAYWVALELIDGARSLWVRRHSKDGLAQSPDGVSWVPITSLEAVGLSSLDAELQLLMPARLAHLRFGKDPDLVRLVSQVVGLADLDQFAEFAGRASTALKKEAGRLRVEVATQASRCSAASVRIEEVATDPVQSCLRYSAAVAENRTAEDVEALTTWVMNLQTGAAAQLAADLGIALPDDGQTVDQLVRRQLDALPANVLSAEQDLAGELTTLFRTSLGLSLPDPTSLQDLETRLSDFEERAARLSRERLAWGQRAARDARLNLMLSASGYLAESEDCPVCSRPLVQVPEVRRALEELRPIAEQMHLNQTIEDLERELLASLENILPPQTRAQANTPLSQRILNDWTQLKENRFPGLLKGVADRFDSRVSAAVENCDSVLDDDRPSLATGYDAIFPEAFAALDQAITSARRYLKFVRGVQASQSQVETDLARHLKATDVSPGQEVSLLVVLRRGKENTETLRPMKGLLADLRELKTSDAARAAAASQARVHEQLTPAMESLKELGPAVRQEVIQEMESLAPEMSRLYQSLYGQDRLEFHSITTGNAANPLVKNELNAYFLVGDERVPVAAYANAGRMRALSFAFAFALLQRARGSLAFLVLDDPALSLDDDHKSRLLDHLIRPYLGERQVILATHYETFFKLAEPVFTDAERLQFAPRRTAADAVSFEPADLLKRLEDTLAKPVGSWREAGVNLRRWAERTLHTLSGYCPISFVIYNDIGGSTKAYAAITDPAVATPRRDRIVQALQSPAFTRIMHRIAHDEEPVESEVRDGLACLNRCRKEVEMEITRLKDLARHDQLGRAIDARPVLTVFAPEFQLPPTELSIPGAAAAAHNGVGVTWFEAEEAVNLAGLGLVLMKSDSLEPMARIGSYLLLDPMEELPGDADLAVVQTADGRRFARRFWRNETEVQLEATNPNVPCAPETLRKGACQVRRVVGVLWFGAPCKRGKAGEEWVSLSGIPGNLLTGVLGIRVQGTSMEPLARDGQIILVKSVERPAELVPGTIACLDIEDVGAVVKLCHPGNDEWVLYPMNTVNVESPMRVGVQDIRRLFEVVGVLFKLDS